MQILDALCEMHDKRVSHMDLKLENILYNSETEEIKIIDFGFSLQEDSPYNLVKYVVGTPAYMAPEHIQSEDINPYMLDVWSVGIILFKLVTG